MSKNLLRGSITYTIGTLQNGDFKYAQEWREYFKQKMEPIGVRVLNPLQKMFKNFKEEGANFNNVLKQALVDGKYEWVHEQMKEIRSRDLRACDVSTFLVAVLDVNKPNWGSVDEIVTSCRGLKPVFLVIPDGAYSRCPLWLCSYFKPNWVYKSIDEVIQALYDIDSGKIPINNKYWKILEQE